MKSKDFWEDSGKNELIMLTMLCLFGAQEKPSSEEVQERASSQ